MNTTDTTDTSVNTTNTTTSVDTTTPKNAMIGAYSEDKAAIAEISAMFIGPALSKKDGKKLSEKETVNLLLHVAKNNRYTMVQKFEAVDVDGVLGTIPEVNEDGEGVWEERDTWALEARRIFALRDTHPEKMDLSSPAGIKRAMAALQAKLDRAELQNALNKLGWEKQS